MFTEKETITIARALNENAKEENENTADFFITTKCVECDDIVSYPTDSFDVGFDYDQNWIVGTAETKDLNDECSECGVSEFLITEISYCGKIVVESDEVKN